jgi:hypothetical protein
VLFWPLTLLVFIGLAFVVVVAIAVSHAARTGRSKLRWSLIGFFVVFLLIFWDWIPTIVLHKYYCVTEAGSWVYKSVDQWKKENPGVMETLEASEVPQGYHFGDNNNFTDTDILNQRINNVFKKTGPLLFNQWRWEEELVDNKTNEVLARTIDFSTGNGKVGGEPELRFWLHSDGCRGGGEDSRFYNFRHQFLGSKK